MSQRFNNIQELMKHLTTNHQMQLEVEHREFPSFEAFKQWKQEEETHKLMLYTKIWI